jgi:very-short-patch-repair endonuclease
MAKPKPHNHNSMKKLRKKLRAELTPAEAKLWSALKNKQLKGRKFRRQQSIGRYIVDFYCPSELLILELDGSVHDDLPRSEYDHARQLYLESLGFTVLRFANEMVFDQLENVLAAIENHFKADKPTTPAPP